MEVLPSVWERHRIIRVTELLRNISESRPSTHSISRENREEEELSQSEPQSSASAPRFESLYHGFIRFSTAVTEKQGDFC